MCDCKRSLKEKIHLFTWKVEDFFGGALLLGAFSLLLAQQFGLSHHMGCWD